MHRVGENFPPLNGGGGMRKIRSYVLETSSYSFSYNCLIIVIIIAIIIITGTFQS